MICFVASWLEARRGQAGSWVCRLTKLVILAVNHRKLDKGGGEGEVEVWEVEREGRERGREKER